MGRTVRTPPHRHLMKRARTATKPARTPRLRLLMKRATTRPARIPPPLLQACPLTKRATMVRATTNRRMIQTTRMTTTATAHRTIQATRTRTMNRRTTTTNQTTPMTRTPTTNLRTPTTARPLMTRMRAVNQTIQTTPTRRGRTAAPPFGSGCWALRSSSSSSLSFCGGRTPSTAPAGTPTERLTF